MTNLTRWDPLREMVGMRNMMDRLFDESGFGSRLWNEMSNSYSLPLDVSETAESYLVKASIPGMDPNDLEITLNDNILTIKGETRGEQEQQQQQFHVRERRSGSFMRTIALPATIDRDHVEASCENGVLSLTLPKSAQAKPRRINVSPTRTVDANQPGSPSSGLKIDGSQGKAQGNLQERGGARTEQSDGQPRMPVTDESSSSAQSQMSGQGMEGGEGRPQ